MNKIIIASLFSGVGFISLPSFATQDLSGFYLSGKVGGSAVHLANQSYSYKDLDYPQDNIKWSGGSNNDTVFGGGIAVGYNFYPQFSLPVRTELEFYARGKASSKYNLWRESAGAFSGREDIKNEITLSSLMLNAYYDFRNDSSFTPYVSAGLGYARIHHKTTDVYELKYYSSEEAISDSRSDTDNNFAWSLGVGVKYNIYDNLSVDLAYRYFDAGKSQITYRNEWNEEFKSRVSVRSNDIMLGVTYDF